MADNANKRISDRKEGRLLRSLPAFARMAPFVMRRRSDAQCVLADSVEITEIEKWIREKRAEGWADLSFLHLMVAAYVRTVTMRPGINRFVAGRRIYARNDIQIVFHVKRGMSVSATETTVKVTFAPSDTVFDVHRRVTEAIDAVKADVSASEPERIAAGILRLPRFVSRIVMAGLRWMDFHDLLPRRILDASPFHASLNVTDLGSLGIIAADTSVPDFGTLPCSVCFGAKRRVREGDTSDARFVDYRLAVDQRIADAYYFSSALKCLKYFLKNPRLLELPPETIEDDVN